MDVSSDQLSQLIQNLAAKRGVKDSLGKPLRPWPVIATVGASGSGKSTFNNTLYEAALALEEEVDTEEQPARPRQLAADSAALDELPFDDSLLLGVRPLPPARLQFFMLAEGDVGHTTQVQGRVMPLPDGGTRPILRFKYRPAAVVLRCVGALLAFIDERDRMRVASGNGRKRGRAAAGLDDQGGSSSRSALPAAGDGVLPEWSSDVENGLKAVGLLHKGSPSVVQLLHDVTREQVVLPGEVRELLGQEVQVTVEGPTVGQQVEGLKAKLSEMTRCFLDAVVPAPAPVSAVKEEAAEASASGVQQGAASASKARRQAERSKASPGGGAAPSGAETAVFGNRYHWLIEDSRLMLPVQGPLDGVEMVDQVGSDLASTGALSFQDLQVLGDCDAIIGVLRQPRGADIKTMAQQLRAAGMLQKLQDAALHAAHPPAPQQAPVVACRRAAAAAGASSSSAPAAAAAAAAAAASAALASSSAAGAARWTPRVLIVLQGELAFGREVRQLQDDLADQAAAGASKQEREEAAESCEATKAALRDLEASATREIRDHLLDQIVRDVRSVDVAERMLSQFVEIRVTYLSLRYGHHKDRSRRRFNQASLLPDDEATGVKAVHDWLEKLADDWHDAHVQPTAKQQRELRGSLLRQALAQQELLLGFSSCMASHDKLKRVFAHWARTWQDQDFGGQLRPRYLAAVEQEARQALSGLLASCTPEAVGSEVAHTLLCPAEVAAADSRRQVGNVPGSAFDGALLRQLQSHAAADVLESNSFGRPDEFGTSAAATLCLLPAFFSAPRFPRPHQFDLSFLKEHLKSLEAASAAATESTAMGAALADGGSGTQATQQSEPGAAAAGTGTAGARPACPPTVLEQFFQDVVGCFAPPEQQPAAEAAGGSSSRSSSGNAGGDIAQVLNALHAAACSRVAGLARQAFSTLHNFSGGEMQNVIKSEVEHLMAAELKKMAAASGGGGGGSSKGSKGTTLKEVLRLLEASLGELKQAALQRGVQLVLRQAEASWEAFRKLVTFEMNDWLAQLEKEPSSAARLLSRGDMATVLLQDHALCHLAYVVGRQQSLLPPLHFGSSRHTAVTRAAKELHDRLAAVAIKPLQKLVRSGEARQEDVLPCLARLVKEVVLAPDVQLRLLGSVIPQDARASSGSDTSSFSRSTLSAVAFHTCASQVRQWAGLCGIEDAFAPVAESARGSGARNNDDDEEEEDGIEIGVSAFDRVRLNLLLLLVLQGRDSGIGPDAPVHRLFEPPTGAEAASIEQQQMSLKRANVTPRLWGTPEAKRKLTELFSQNDITWRPVSQMTDGEKLPYLEELAAMFNKLPPATKGPSSTRAGTVVTDFYPVREEDVRVGAPPYKQLWGRVRGRMPNGRYTVEWTDKDVRHENTSGDVRLTRVTWSPAESLQQLNLDGPDSLATLLSPELIELGLLQVEDDLKAEGLPIDDLKPVVRRYDMSMAGLDEAWEFRSKKRKRFSVTRAQGDQYYVFWGVRDPVTGKPLPWVPGQPRRDPQDVLIFRSRPSALRFKESGQDSKDAGLGAFKKHLLADLAKKNQPPAPPLPPPPVEPAAGSSDAAGADADVPVPLRRPLRKRPLPEQSLPDRRPASAPGAKSLVGGKRTATAAELLPPRAPPQQQQQQHQAAAAKRRRADPKAGASGADLLLLAAAAAAEDKQGQNAAGAAGGAAPASASALRWVRGAANVLKQGAPAPSKSTAPGAAARGATRSNVAAPERQETAQHARSNGSTTDAAGSRPKMLKMSSLLDLL